MRFEVESEYDIPMLILSRRNLRALLIKLDDPSSKRTLISPDRDIAVKAEDDETHYGDRGYVPGVMHPNTETILLQDKPV